jgi:multiple sugar transport system ATP-binding protein
MSFLELERLEKVFPGGKRAVKAIDLSVAEGEFAVLLGPSGCGKTTTLRMVAGLEQASGGRVRLGGRDVTRLRPSQRDVGFVFQFYALYPHMSVAENVAFPLACAGVQPAERRERVERVARRLGIEPLLPRRPRELSGGDQQRVALARAMVRRPSIYLMDEPLGTLDADLRMEMLEFIRSQQLDFRVTTLYVTHDQEEAMRLADRIVVMHEGLILQAAPPAEVYDRPATLFVARFVGSPGMNLVQGEVVGSGGEALFRPQGSTVAVTLAGAAPLGPAVLGIRPEFVRASPTGAIRGRIVVDEYLGADRCWHLETEIGPLTARAAPDAPGAAGEEVALELDRSHARLFDTRTGERRA